MRCYHASGLQKTLDTADRKTYNQTAATQDGASLSGHPDQA